MKILKFGVALVFVSATAFGSVFSNLSPQDQASIQKGEMVTNYTPNDDKQSSWPNSAAYKRMEATPEESAAVFFDFNIQKDYIANLKNSHIAEKLSSTSWIVDYEIKLPFFLKPFFKDTTYSVQDDISFDPATNSYTVKWAMTKGAFLKNIAGHATFEPLGTGTLIAYVNEMTPAAKGMNNGLVVNEIKKGSKEAVEDIIEKILNERKNQPQLLQEQIIKLGQAFGKL